MILKFRIWNWKSPPARWLSAVLAALTAAAAPEASAQEPLPAPPTGPACAVPPRRGGPLRRLVRHTSRTLHEQFIGDPAQFAVPPLGASVNGTFGAMVARADAHDFVLYQSDFVGATSSLS